MNGGCFVSGVNADNAEAVTFTGKTESTFWKGISLTGCDSIGIYKTNISIKKQTILQRQFQL